MADEVEREITVPVEPERAWELITEPEHLERWFAERVELEPTPGAPVRVVGDDGGEAFARRAGVSARIAALSVFQSAAPNALAINSRL